MPQRDIAGPAMAGPNINARFVATVETMMAFINWSLGTKVETVALRTGCPIAINMPRTAALRVADK
jgi:hypothetical protein